MVSETLYAGLSRQDSLGLPKQDSLVLPKQDRMENTGWCKED